MQRVMITGIGTINAAGCGAEQFWQSLTAGRGPAATPTLYDPASLGGSLVLEARELNGADVVYRKGVSVGERGMHMAVSAAQLALADAHHTPGSLAPERVGIAFGATLDSLRALGAFHARTQQEGPRCADPGLFPNTGMSAAACQISIALGYRAFNATLSNGMTAGLDAIGYGADMLRAGRADAVIVGGLYALSYEVHLGFHLQGALAEASTLHPGFVLGEGAAALVLETFESAQARGASPIAEVLGHASIFDPTAEPGYNPFGKGAAKAIAGALRRSDRQPHEVDLVMLNASGDRAADLMERRALRKVFGGQALPAQCAVKQVCGETYSAAGAFQTAAAALALSRGLPTSSGTASAPPKTALVNSFGFSGLNTSLLLAAA